MRKRTQTVDLRAQLSPGCVDAQYSEQRIPQYQGNPLIEALPPVMSDDELFNWLSVVPSFDPEQRNWEPHERLQLLLQLKSFMVPLMANFELGRFLDSMLRNGYVGREPNTPAHAMRFQRIYENQKNNVPFRETRMANAAQISALLIGMSGMGKTSTLRRWFSHIPRVIFHSELNLYQVPYLHIEMPSDGASVKGLAAGILQQMDQLLPGANYYSTYGAARAGADMLMRSVARVLNMHCVGFLVADEVQNVLNSPKGGQTLMTELVSACNDLGVPILFVGTNKADKVFSLDYRMSRRVSGEGLAPWDRLHSETTADGVNEWEDFMGTLWQFQWVRQPVELSQQLLDTMYHYSQGVIDIAIKLFAGSQARAMLDGTECISAELIKSVYDSQMKLLHPMVEALRDNNLESLATFPDIAPIGLDAMVTDMRRRLQGRGSKAFRVKRGDESFVPRIATSLMAAGFEEQESVAAAEVVQATGTATNLVQGTKDALDLMTTPKPARTKRKRVATEKDAPSVPTPDDLDPGDYRRATRAAESHGTTAHEQLGRLGMLKPVEELIELQ